MTKTILSEVYKGRKIEVHETKSQKKLVGAVVNDDSHKVAIDGEDVSLRVMGGAGLDPNKWVENAKTLVDDAIVRKAKTYKAVTEAIVKQVKDYDQFINDKAPNRKKF